MLGIPNGFYINRFEVTLTDITHANFYPYLTLALLFGANTQSTAEQWKDMINIVGTGANVQFGSFPQLIEMMPFPITQPNTVGTFAVPQQPTRRYDYAAEGEPFYVPPNQNLYLAWDGNGDTLYTLAQGVIVVSGITTPQSAIPGSTLPVRSGTPIALDLNTGR